MKACHLAARQSMSQVGFRLDPNRPRLRQGTDPAEALYREQIRRDSEIAHEYLSQGNKWKCDACGNYNARRVQVCDHCHTVRK